ncbi:MAG TPA: DsrE family protein [Puia sp.]|nr:DsrE family protein [Puia sp.]
MKSIFKAVLSRGVLGVMVIFSLAARSEAQQRDYKVVFDLTSKDPDDQMSVIRWIREITSGNQDAEIEVVLYGGSLGMVTKAGSTVADAVADLMKNKHVQFDVCSIAMKNHHLGKEDLLPGVETVPDGIYEIISKQRQGWGYIKATH